MVAVLMKDKPVITAPDPQPQEATPSNDIAVQISALLSQRKQLKPKHYWLQKEKAHVDYASTFL